MQLTTQDGRVMPLRPGESTLGRGHDNNIVVPNLSVSRRHACFRWDGNTLMISDNGSANGTWLDGRRLPAGEWTPVRPGAQLRFGDDLNVQVTPGAAAPYPGATISAPPQLRPSPVSAYPPPVAPFAGAGYAPAAQVPAPHAPAAIAASGKGGFDLLLTAVDISLSRAKLTVALGGTIVAGLVLGLALVIAARILLDGPALAVLFTVLGAVAAWVAITLTIGAITRMSLNDLAGRPPVGVREALQYAFRRLPEFAFAPLALGVLVALVVMAEVVVMLIGRVEVVGEVITSLLFVPAVVLNLFLGVLIFFGGSLLFPIIVDRGRGVFGALSYLLTLMRRAPGRVVFYLGMAMIVTWLATLVLWLLVLSALGLTGAVISAGAGSGFLLGLGGGSSMLTEMLLSNSGLGSYFGASAGSTVATWLLQLGILVVVAVTSAFPMVLQITMGSAVYLNVKDEVVE